jgi:hypothetical protein
LVVGFVSSAREQFKLVRERLISERVAKSMQAELPMSQLGVEQLEEFLVETKSLIANQPRSELNGKQLATLIRQIVDTGLRPLSHKLWEREDRSLPNFAARALMQRAISNSPYPLSAILGTIALSNFGGNFREATFTQGMAHFAIQILLVAVVVVTANRVKGMLPKITSLESFS